MHIFVYVYIYVGVYSTGLAFLVYATDPLYSNALNPPNMCMRTHAHVCIREREHSTGFTSWPNPNWSQLVRLT